MLGASNNVFVRGLKIQKRFFRARGPQLAVNTKKSYAELPNTYILPDGTPAQPLEQWHASTQAEVLESSKHSRSRRRVAKETLSAIQDTSDGVLKKPKKRKEVEVVDDDVKSRPKRVSRKVKDAEEVESTPVPKGGVLMPEILENLQRFPHCILFTRVGKFYESYYDQAHEVARLLNIKLAYRRWSNKVVPFCGFPLQHIDKYLKILVQQNGRFVALCEEFPRYNERGVVAFDRRVARVVTPGTLIDESFLNQYENNYLLAISPSVKGSGLGFAWIDVSTGEFYTKLVAYEALRDELARIGPREIVLDKCFEHAQPPQLRDALKEESRCISFTTPQADAQMEEDRTEFTPVDDVTSTSNVPSVPLLSEYSQLEQDAINVLTTYLRVNLLDHMPALSSPAREGAIPRLQIDSHTIKALEIRESLREGGVKGSLLSAIKRTRTSSGTRLLARWLCSPSTSLPEINARQSLVAFFYNRSHFHDDLIVALASVEDASRIVQKFLLGKGDATDLHAVRSTIVTWMTIKARILQERQQEELETGQTQRGFQADEWNSLDALIGRMAKLHELSDHIGRALKPKSQITSFESTDGVDDEGIASQSSDRDGISARPVWRIGDYNWTIKPDYSEKLSSLHIILDDLILRREALQNALQLKYDAPSLTLRSSPAHGMHVHLLKAKRDSKQINQDPAFVNIAASGTTKCYFHGEWAQLGGQIIETANALTMAEKEAFESLRSQVNSHAPQLRRNARILDELDVTLAFADLAREMRFARPTLTESQVYDVKNGRHPTVELGLLTNGRVFTPNSLQLTPESRLHVITGPNMAGKSTFLRQSALIVVLAQAGSFVPADSATIGIVDKLFSRVGAKDDLFHDRSTFMVEMLETAEILQRATPRSLVIMDEVGRGTTVKDGLAIAFATVHHLITFNQCRALFATHFHEIADILGYPTLDIFKNVGFFCTDVDETDASLHELLRLIT
ncbi:DNA mismatch repair protein [Mycena indigotica]|uniref:DNA mismatch repair protein n=1 Tax=Mycena indigotica TaxID=2126181 RepID=A0A8H6W6I4_9AGAR|nr:DNA mismatch repair protein [Mycena indigotica]KAF7306692.1 DNA mismatch repair protein [Mycena indigotica]